MAEKAKTKKKKKFYRDVKFWVRLMAALLCALMVLGTLTMLIQMLAFGSYAAEPDERYYTEEGDDLLMAIGLMYADGVTVGFETRSESGFRVGYTDAGRLFHPLWELPEQLVSVVCDAALSKEERTYSLAGWDASSVIGAWRVECVADGEQSALFYSIQNAAALCGMDAYPALRNGRIVICAGSFFSAAEAQEAAGRLAAASGLLFSAAECSDTGVRIVNPENDRILFACDGVGAVLALAPLPAADGSAGTLITPAGNTYSGFFKYTRYDADGVDGVAVTNILPLDEYVMGVVASEIGTSWDTEAMKAFAVAVRSYALTSFKHRTFDLCNSGCCQMYKGSTRVTDKIREAVRATTEQVVSYGGAIAKTTYSSSTGGCTVDCREVWGKTLKYPYLTAVLTPWENYEEINYGQWSLERSPSELAQMLLDAGYEGLTGAVASVRILSTGENSAYVTALEFADSFGHTVVVERTDAIRNTLNLYSANFVVGRAGETVTRPVWRMSESAAETPDGGGCYVLDSDGLGVMELPEFVSVAGNDTLDEILTGGLAVLGADGEIRDFDPSAFTVTEGDGTWVELGETIAGQEFVQLAGEENGNFVFYGRGWGHGVGLSQYGAQALAKLGCPYSQILSLYYPGTTLGNLTAFIVPAAR